jgi:hypothetical protein
MRCGVKDEHEFFDVTELPWAESEDAPGVSERLLSSDTVDDTASRLELTRLARWAPGLDTSAAGVIRHPYFEEVYLLQGDLEDLTLGRVFTRGHFASRPPGMPHGPYRTRTGCLMLEIRYPGR